MLENLFGSRTRVKLLKLFLLEEGDFYVREIAKITSEQLNSVRRELENLEKLGLIISVDPKLRGLGGDSSHINIEKRKFYSVNKEFVLYDDLKNLFLKSRLLVEREIAAELSKLGKVKFLVLSGFFVDDPSAKTDMLIVGQINKNKLKNLISKISKDFGKEIRYTSMSTQEFKFRNNITDKFLFEVLEGKKIVVVDNLGRG